MERSEEVLDLVLEELAYNRVFQIDNTSERDLLKSIIITADEIRAAGELVATSSEVRKKYKEKFKFYYFIKRETEKIVEEHQEAIDLYNFLGRRKTREAFIKTSYPFPLIIGKLLGIALRDLYPPLIAKAMMRCNSVGVTPEIFSMRYERTQYEFYIKINENFDEISDLFSPVQLDPPI